MKKVSISALIGYRYFTLNGYTSPQATVQLNNPQLNLTTQSDQDGYFAFPRQLITSLSEICLLAIDNDHRSTQPLCLPPPPPQNYYTHIGPVVLPPSLSLNQIQTQPYSTSLASGQAVPNSPITIFIYQASSKAPLLPRPAAAFSLPQLTASTDSLGHFSFNLPTTLSTDYRLFVTAAFQNQPSPKSTTLAYHLPQILTFSRLLPLFFFLLIVVACLLVKILKNPRRRSTPSAIIKS